MSGIKIQKKIVGYAVATNKEPVEPVAEKPSPATPAAPDAAALAVLDEKMPRPERLVGATYKIKSPMLEHALYVTINDIVLNAGTPHASRRPFEIFINWKNWDKFQWIEALQRIMSAVFRKGGDSSFLIEEMKAVFDPRGGYFKPGGTYVPSIIAEIGHVLESHMIEIGLVAEPELSAEQLDLIASKRAEYESRLEAPAEGSSSYPPGATTCPKCSERAVILMDGCSTCLSCGSSKCN